MTRVDEDVVAWVDRRLELDGLLSTGVCGWNAMQVEAAARTADTTKFRTSMIIVCSY